MPFTFPEFVTPAGKKMSKKEKIEVNVNPGTENEVLCKTTSHPLKVFTASFSPIVLPYKLFPIMNRNHDFFLWDYRN